MEKAMEPKKAAEAESPAAEPSSRSEIFERGTMLLEEASGGFGTIRKPEKTFTDIISEKQAA
jgi:hypothetical protein